MHDLNIDDFNIISNNSLRDMLYEWPKYRDPKFTNENINLKFIWIPSRRMTDNKETVNEKA